MATLLTRLAESVTDKVFYDAAFLMLTNRKVQSNGAVDDKGGYAKDFFAVRLAEWIEEFLANEKERILDDAKVLDAFINTVKKGGA